MAREGDSRRGLRRGLIGFALCACALLASSAPAGAVTLQPGDILIADQSAFGGGGAVILVDPVTGQQTVVSNNAINAGTDLFADPFGIVLDATGRILVADESSQGVSNNGGVIRVDPASGQQTAVSNDTINTGTDLFDDPNGLALDPQGRILIADGESQGVSFTGAVIRVDPATGQQTAVSTNTINTGTDLFSEPSALTLDAYGRIMVADENSQGVSDNGAVIAVEPATGKQTAVSNDIVNTGTDLFKDPVGIALAAGRILVADVDSQGVSFTGALIAVDPATGQQTPVSNNTISGPDLFENPTGIVVVPGRCRGLEATLTGTAARDILNGTAARDVIATLGGNDAVKSLGGNDVVCGGAGKDRLTGGAGADTLVGEAGADALRGGKGRDRLLGGRGRDRLIGGAGRDRLRGGPGRDFQRQ